MNQHYHFQMPKLSPSNKAIIIGLVAVFLANSVLQKFAGGQTPLAYLGLSAFKLAKGHIYQLVTYPIVMNQLIEIVFNGLVLWFLGSELEYLWGQRKYLGLLAASTLSGGVIYFFVDLLLASPTLLHTPLTGMAGICSSLCVVYAFLFPDRPFLFMFIFPLKAKYFCLLIIAMEFWIGAFSRNGVHSWGHLGAMLGGAIFFWWNFKRPKRRRPPGPKIDKWGKKSHLKLVKGDDDPQNRPPKYWQ